MQCAVCLLSCVLQSQIVQVPDGSSIGDAGSQRATVEFTLAVARNEEKALYYTKNANTKHQASACQLQ